MSESYLSSLFGLNNKTAVVMGGTGELCGAISEGLAGAGAEVVLVGRNEEKAQKRIEKIKSAGGKAYFVLAEVTRSSDLEQVLGSVKERSGGLDILVNGAGINSATPFLEVSEEELDRILDVNVKSLYKCCQIFGRYFIERGKGGAVINVGSMSGLTPLSRVFTYSMSKAAVHNLSKNLAREWAPHKIRVNTLVPGFFPAGQNRKVLTPDRIEDIMRHTPAKRFGEAHELIGAVLLLASNSASSFMTGTELVVDGGYASMTI